MSNSENKNAIIVDFDGTIADTEVTSVQELINKSQNLFVDREMDAFFKPLLDSPEVINKLAKKYKIIYLSSGFSILGLKEEVTRVWLKNYGFPEGELIFRKLMVDPNDVLEYKLIMITKLKERKVKLIAGIGNTVSDAFAYMEHNIRTIILGNPKVLPKGAERVQNWLEIEQKLL